MCHGKIHENINKYKINKTVTYVNLPVNKPLIYEYNIYTLTYNNIARVYIEYNMASSTLH